MNRHDDFCQDSECDRCHPAAFKAAQEREREKIKRATKDLTDRQVQVAYFMRKEKDLISRKTYLEDEIKAHKQVITTLEKELVDLKIKLTEIGTEDWPL